MPFSGAVISKFATIAKVELEVSLVIAGFKASSILILTVLFTSVVLERFQAKGVAVAAVLLVISYQVALLKE
jgi:hypothetical protein